MFWSKKKEEKKDHEIRVKRLAFQSDKAWETFIKKEAVPIDVSTTSYWLLVTKSYAMKIIKRGKTDKKKSKKVAQVTVYSHCGRMDEMYF